MSALMLSVKHSNFIVPALVIVLLCVKLIKADNKNM